MIKYYVELGVALLAATFFFGSGFYLATLRANKQIAALRLEQSQQIAAEQRAAVLALQAVQQHEHETTARNQQIIVGLQSALDASDSNANAIAVRLRNALAAVATYRNLALSSAPSGPQPTAPRGEPGGVGPLEQATAEFIGACTRDAARLNALIEEITPQLQ